MPQQLGSSFNLCFQTVISDTPGKRCLSCLELNAIKKSLHLWLWHMLIQPCVWFFWQNTENLILNLPVVKINLRPSQMALGYIKTLVVIFATHSSCPVLVWGAKHHCLLCLVIKYGWVPGGTLPWWWFSCAVKLVCVLAFVALTFKRVFIQAHGLQVCCSQLDMVRTTVLWWPTHCWWKNTLPSRRQLYYYEYLAKMYVQVK